MSVEIRPARPGEAGLVLNFVRELAAYEKLADEVEADEGAIDDALFAKAPKAFCDIAEWDGEPAGFALWFLNFSSFRGRNGLYRGHFRATGVPRARHRPRHAAETRRTLPRAGMDEAGMGGSRLEPARHRLLRGSGRNAFAGLDDLPDQRKRAAASRRRRQD